MGWDYKNFLIFFLTLINFDMQNLIIAIKGKFVC
jgi:hypothetical protein